MYPYCPTIIWLSQFLTFQFFMPRMNVTRGGGGGEIVGKSFGRALLMADLAEVVAEL